MSTLIPTLAALTASMTAGCDAAAERPLFECDATLELVLELPMKTLIRRAERRPEVDGKLRYRDVQGSEVELDVRVETRGHSRLEMCHFPPLSLMLAAGQTRGTVFAGQDKLKIVTQCRRGGRYLEYLLQEYGIYRAYGLLTNPAFRVRMLKITFRDSEGRRPDLVQGAFFIESLDEVAARSDLRAVEQHKISAGQLDPSHANQTAVFQFMIGNTDWSIGQGPAGEPCCHNGKVLGEPGSGSGWFVLPYDFDQAGLINTPYALPDDRLRIRSVRHRLFRGRCAYMHHLQDTIDAFNRQRDGIEAALASGGLSDKTKRAQAKYIASFYEIINDPENLERNITSRCVVPAKN